MSPRKDWDRSAYDRAYREKNRVKVLARRREYRRTHKAAVKRWACTYRKKSRSKILARVYNKTYHRAQKLRVMEAYGKVCQCCGESNPGFLTIDHMKNNGAQHRSELRCGGRAIYPWLIAHKFPPSFQVLCYNCNIGRSRQPNHQCPHKSC